MSDLDEMEDYYRKQLYELQKAYERAAEPIIKRLTEIHALRPMPPIVIPMSHDELKRFPIPVNLLMSKDK